MARSASIRREEQFCLSADGRHGVGYARSHELDPYRSDSGGGLWATVRHVRVAGAVVKIEVVDGADNVVHVQLGREQYEGLHLAAGEKVHVTPKRMRVFTSDRRQATSIISDTRGVRFGRIDLVMRPALQ